MEVPDPAPYCGINISYYYPKRFYRHLTLRKGGDTIFDRLQGFLRWLNMGIHIPRFHTFFHTDGKAKKIKLLFVSIDNLCLRLIQSELQPLKYLAQYCHRFVGFTSPAKDDNIVRVADDTGAQALLKIIPLPYPVQ